MIYRMQLLTSREPAVICTIQTLRSTRTRLIQTGAGYCLVFAPCLWFNFSLFTQVAPNTSQAHRTAQADYCIALGMGARLFTQGAPHISFNGWARKLDDLIGRNISNQSNLIGKLDDLIGRHISNQGNLIGKLDDLIGRDISKQGNLIGSHVSSLFE